MKLKRTSFALFTSLLAGLSLIGCTDKDWRSASREPAGIAPNPNEVSEAVIEFYAADAYSWRGWFAVHSWLAVKPQNANKYTVYEVVGWRKPALNEYKTDTRIAIGMELAQRKFFLFRVKKQSYSSLEFSTS